jgi:gamma-glutamyl hydrolase
VAHAAKLYSLDFDVNMAPIIGIVSQPLDDSMVNDSRFAGTDSYMMSAYVKFMEASGARVVPLIWNEPDEIWQEKLSKVNGVLFPGGNGNYVEYGRKIMNRLIQYNDEGTFFPAWGTCLGFEDMLIWASDRGKDILEVYNAHATSLTLDFVVDPVSTKMF